MSDPRHRDRQPDRSESEETNVAPDRLQRDPPQRERDPQKRPGDGPDEGRTDKSKPNPATIERAQS